MEWCVVPASRFGNLAPTWDAFEEAHAPVPFLRSSFVGAALDAFGTGRELVATLQMASGAAAMGIFAPARFGVWQTFQPSQLPLGPFIVRSDVDRDAVIGSLVRALPKPTVAVALTQQDPWLSKSPSASPTLEVVPYIETAWVTIDGDFRSYWEARGKNLQQNVKRQLAKLEKQGTMPKLEMVDHPSDVARAIEDYGRLETAGWKSDEGTAVGAANAQGRFYRIAFERFCRDGVGRIYCYRIADRIAAMDLCVLQGEVMVVLKTAYDETFKSISPASLMRHEYFRLLFDEASVRRIEFYGRLMEWHTRWTDNKRVLYHVNRFRWPWVRRFRNAFRADASS